LSSRLSASPPPPRVRAFFPQADVLPVNLFFLPLYISLFSLRGHNARINLRASGLGKFLNRASRIPPAFLTRAFNEQRKKCRGTGGGTSGLRPLRNQYRNHFNFWRNI
jgi:hypothetical protein